MLIKRLVGGAAEILLEVFVVFFAIDFGVARLNRVAARPAGHRGVEVHHHRLIVNRSDIEPIDSGFEVSRSYRTRWDNRVDHDAADAHR